MEGVRSKMERREGGGGRERAEEQTTMGCASPLVFAEMEEEV